MTAKILEALKKLDVNNDNHWTDDGLPRMDTIKFMSGDPALTREQVTAALPGFSRASPTGVEQASPPATPAATPAVVVTNQGQNDAPVQGSAGAGEANKEGEQGDAKAQLAARLEVAQTAMVEAAARKEAATKDHAAASAKVDELVEALAEAGGVETLADQLNGYFASRKRQQQDQADRRAALKGINLKDLLPAKAPIDQAMARKTSRGAQRPTTLK